MLVIRRRAGESILIGEEIEVEIVEVSAGRVTVGIRAPRRVPILRREIRLSEEQNRAAAMGQSGEGIARLVSAYFR
jgi:carbon storage regulator